MAVEGSVPQQGVIVPHLVVADAALAVAFYQRAFDAEILYRSPSPSGQGETHSSQALRLTHPGFAGGA